MVQLSFNNEVSRKIEHHFHKFMKKGLNWEEVLKKKRDIMNLIPIDRFINLSRKKHTCTLTCSGIHIHHAAQTLTRY